MSIDFEAIINSAMKDGSSSEDLAKQFTDALNTINKRKDEENAKAKLREKRFNYLVDLADKVSAKIHADTSLDEIAKYLAWYTATATPEGKTWTIDEINGYLDVAQKFIPIIHKEYDRFVKAQRKLEGLFNKSNKVEKPTCTCKGGTGRCSETQELDDKAIMEFLDSLFK